MKKTILIMLLCVATLFNTQAQTVNMFIVSGGFDNCANPLPNAGTYTASGTVNGKNAYFKGSNLKIIWTGSQWELQAKDNTVSGSTFIACWFNTNNTATPPADCWQASFGCFAIGMNGPDAAPSVSSITITRAGFNIPVSGTASYTVVFSSTVNTLLTSNFTITSTGTVSGASVASVSQVNSTTWTVNVNTGTGDGTIALNMANGTGTGVAFCATLPQSGPTYTVNSTTTTGTTLSAGDIAFTGYNSASTTADDFSFIVLRNGGLPTGTQIYFTDNGYGTVESGLRPNEGLMLWTATSTVSQFTQVKVTSTISPAGYTVTAGSATAIQNGTTLQAINLSSAGDQVLAFQGNMASPTYIAGIHMNAETATSGNNSSTLAGWDDFTGTTPFTISSSRSHIPPGLTNGTDAVMIATIAATNIEFDNAIYNCAGATAAASVAAMRSAINDKANWSAQDVTIYTTPPSCSFSVNAPCTNPTTPTINATSTTNCGAVSTTLSIASGTLNSATNWQWYTGGCGSTSAGSGTSINVSPSSTTTYYVRGEGGCVTPGSCANQTITVNPIPSTPTITPATSTTFCTGGSVSLSSSSATGNQWYLNGNPIGGATNQTYVAGASGSYTVVVTSSGCSSSPSTGTTVTVNTTPVADAPSNVTACDAYTLPALTVGNYFTGSGGTGTALSAGNVISSSQTLYVYAETGTTPNCTNENSFTVTINVTPTADAPGNVISCGAYTLPALTVGNYFTGSGGTGTALTAGNTISSSQTIYVYAETGTTPNCSNENSFTVTINTPTTFYADGDGDGYGDLAVKAYGCTAPANYVADSTDCNDGNVNVHPGATEICDGLDNDCNGSIDDGISVTPAVSIAITAGSAIPCVGSPVTFTATPSNTGTGGTVTYAWYRNTTLVAGATTNVMTTSNLPMGINIKCVLTTTGSCVTSSAATSNLIKIYVKTNNATLPSNLTVTGITNNVVNPAKRDVSLSWQNFSLDTVYFRNVLSTTGAWSKTAVSINGTAKISGATAFSNYEWYVRSARCTGVFNSARGWFNTGGTGACSNPAPVITNKLFNCTTNLLTLTYTGAAGSNILFYREIAPTLAANYSHISITNNLTGTKSNSLSGLANNKTYEFFLVSNCGSSNYSSINSFETITVGCPPVIRLGNPDAAVSTTSTASTSSAAEAITVYPNPNNGNFTLDINTAEMNVSKIELVNVLGETVYAEMVKDNNYNHQINLTSFNNGVYLLMITDAEGKRTMKQVVVAK